MLAGVFNIGSIDILVTKAIAFCDGLTQAIAFRYKYVQAEGDSKILSCVVSMTYLISVGEFKKKSHYRYRINLVFL